MFGSERYKNILKIEMHQRDVALAARKYMLLFIYSRDAEIVSICHGVHYSFFGIKMYIKVQL